MTIPNSNEILNTTYTDYFTVSTNSYSNDFERIKNKIIKKLKLDYYCNIDLVDDDNKYYYKSIYNELSQLFQQQNYIIINNIVDEETYKNKKYCFALPNSSLFKDLESQSFYDDIHKTLENIFIDQIDNLKIENFKGLHL